MGIFFFGKRIKRHSHILNQKNVLKSLLYSMQEGVLITDLSGNVSEINLTLMNIFNLDPHTDYYGRPASIVLQIPEIEQILNVILNEKSGLLEKEFSLTDKKYLSVKASPFVTDDNKILGALLVFNDVSKLKELEGMRRTFAANVSHELRTPLTSIQGYVETILDGKVNDENILKSFLQIVHNQTTRLRGIIDDLMSLSKIENIFESGDLELQVSNLEIVVKAAIRQCEEKVRHKRINVLLVIEKDYPIKINNRLMEQAVSNLLDNAIKFSPVDSKVIVTIKSLEQELILSVSDQGPGILKKHHQRIFERFYMVDKARSRELGGSGLGLSIVKHIVQIHKGRVDVKSEMNQGAEFFIFLPIG